MWSQVDMKVSQNKQLSALSGDIGLFYTIFRDASQSTGSRIHYLMDSAYKIEDAGVRGRVFLAIPARGQKDSCGLWVACRNGPDADKNHLERSVGKKPGHLVSYPPKDIVNGYWFYRCSRSLVRALPHRCWLIITVALGIDLRPRVGIGGNL